MARNAKKQFDGLVLGELERHLSDLDFRKQFRMGKVQCTYESVLSMVLVALIDSC